MSNKNHLTADELWRKITTINTIQEWMDLTNGFSLFTIYDHFRILHDPEKVETYQCLLRKEYPMSLEAFDIHDPSAVCYMMMGNGNLRRSSNPSFFDKLVDEGARSARNDGPYVSETTDEETDTSASEATPTVVQIAAILELLSQLGVDYKTSDKSKIINLICLLTGRGSSYISKKVYQGFSINKRHEPFVSSVNTTFCDLHLPISIKSDQNY